MTHLTEVYQGTDEKCPKCTGNGRENPAELTHAQGLIEPGVWALVCAKHGHIREL